MTLIPPTRKRTRSCEEEDFLPLSKKINNLHINNWGNVDPTQEQLLDWNNPSDQILNYYSNGVLNGRQDSISRHSTPFKGAQENLQNGYAKTELTQDFKNVNNQESYKSSSNSSYSLDKYMSNESSSTSNREQSGWSPVYNPDLDINENPYYYESNKLLFDLYIERLQRTGY